jgi:transposase
VISVEDWAEIRRLHRAEQMPIRAIARKLGIARNTVRRAIAGNEPPKYRRAPKGSIVDAVEPQIRELLEHWPDMPVTVIAERIGWTRGMTVLKDRVRECRKRPAYRSHRAAYSFMCTHFVVVHNGQSPERAERIGDQERWRWQR